MAVAQIDMEGDVSNRVVRSPLRHLDRETVNTAAAAETRNREVHLPPVTAYRWWARRTEAINGAVLDAIASDCPGRLLVVDPFAGGGVIPLAAVLRRHQAYAQDLNPWAVAGLTGMLDLPNASDLGEAQGRLRELVATDLRRAYGTTYSDGSSAEVSHTFRVGTATCPECGARQRLFPHALVSLHVRRERRQPAAFLACPEGHLFEGIEDGGVQSCPTCDRPTDPHADYTTRRLKRCAPCGTITSLEALANNGEWVWEVVLIERTSGRRRELATPSPVEVATADSSHWQPTFDLGDIPDGLETRVLRRHGFKRWADLYPRRQRSVMERLLAQVDVASASEPTRRALRLAVYGSAEMAGHLSRWDRFYLKSYEAMAGHRFNFSTFVAEPNVWGTAAAGRGSVRRRLTGFVKAANWMHTHGIDELRIDGPLPASGVVSGMTVSDVRIVEGSSERILLPDHSADVVLTDPPYHDDVQYGELSLPLRAWARLATNDLDGEASVNPATQQNTSHHAYRRLLTTIFRECRRVLRPDGHLILSYANRDPRAWEDVLGALQDADFSAAGYTVLHSENETDVVKRGIRACTLDFMIDAVPKGMRIEAWCPASMPTSDEGDFLTVVGDTFRLVGDLTANGLSAMRDRLHKSRFLASNESSKTSSAA